MAQILETPLLSLLNYQILIATKAARLREVPRRARCWSSACAAGRNGAATPAPGRR
jgi:hypothetical protein